MVNCLLRCSVRFVVVASAVEVGVGEEDVELIFGEKRFCGWGMGEKARFWEAPVRRFMRRGGGVEVWEERERVSESESAMRGGVEGGEWRGRLGDGGRMVISEGPRVCLRPRGSSGEGVVRSVGQSRGWSEASWKGGEGVRLVVGSRE